MKRFYSSVTVCEAAQGWRIELDQRPVQTVGGAPQLLGTQALADSMAEEWRQQGSEIDVRSFPFRDLADLAIDDVTNNVDDTVAKLLQFAQTDTLCYRAEPGEPLRLRQDEVWEPLLQAAETRQAVRFARISGIIHHPQPADTLARLRAHLVAMDPFTLVAVQMMAGLAGSLIIALAALEPEADVEQLWNAANLEEDWQALHWGWDTDALKDRTIRKDAFATASRFAALARHGKLARHDK
ncbi:ATP12 family protein [Croceicoccus sp. F390]|uniref:ATP12 family protein n=1 Tax=Croceicoccus esteveae TaxID=3075597 RepID=A0ABU2ZDG9_9SPHN|nr:ATP12 family protein [Croceicoccus sp. F390]MDT0574642.1 ATP12 family protein [Croceicoccus sp. F390]